MPVPHEIGYDRRQLTALTIRQVTEAADVAATAEQPRRLQDGAVTSFRTESSCRRQDGQTLRAIVNVSAVLGPDGSPQYVVAQFEDVAERPVEVELR